MGRVRIAGAAVQVLRPRPDESSCRAGFSCGAFIESAPSRFRLGLVFTYVWWFENQSREVTDRLVHELRANMDFAVVRRNVNRPRTLWDNVEISDRVTPLVANERFRQFEPLFVACLGNSRGSGTDRQSKKGSGPSICASP